MAKSKHNVEDLIALFNSCFQESTNTILVRGDDEPLYIPAGDDCPYHRIVFAHGFFSSALHEIAHWTIAGAKRRLLFDYGYWYKPDGRNAEEQAQFFEVESKPQAIEWILSDACDFPFHISLDNLNGDAGDEAAFRALVEARKRRYLEEGLPPRAAIFREALLSQSIWKYSTTS